MRLNARERDPRDGARGIYLGDDHLNPDLRVSVNRLVNKLNRLTVMENPENREAVLRKLAIDLPPFEAMNLVSVLIRSMSYQLDRIPFFHGLLEVDDVWQAEYKLRTQELSHTFEPTISRVKAGKKLNRCVVCGERRDHPFHETLPSIPSSKSPETVLTESGDDA